MAFRSKTFTGAGEFEAMYAAERWLKERGFSVGRQQAHAPRGILFGDFEVAKWRNLSTEERVALHGTMTGDGRNGPITVLIFSHVPAVARAALTDGGTAGIADALDALWAIVYAMGGRDEPSDPVACAVNEAVDAMLKVLAAHGAVDPAARKLVRMLKTRASAVEVERIEGMPA